MRIVLFTLSLILGGCASNQSTNENVPNAGRYQLDNDTAPQSPISVKHIEDAHPRYEARSLSSNKDYTLFNKKYLIVKEPKNFTQEGVSSWYGNKFHGHKTSNGEVYDMYSMSAAHKTLPIPSYVKVTNKDNNKTAIVRINDRGPFHEGRIIDLSFAAATKLDVIKTGTANVQIEYIFIEKPTTSQDWNTISSNLYYIQMIAVKNNESAKKSALLLEKEFNTTSNILKSDSIFRVRLGPFLDRDIADKVLLNVKKSSYPTAFIIKEKKQLP